MMCYIDVHWWFCYVIGIVHDVWSNVHTQKHMNTHANSENLMLENTKFHQLFTLFHQLLHIWPKTDPNSDVLL